MTAPLTDTLRLRQAARRLWKRYAWPLLARTFLTLGIPAVILAGGAWLLKDLAPAGLPFIITALATVAAAAFVGSGLFAGLTKTLVCIARKESLPPAPLFCGMKHCLRFLGLFAAMTLCLLVRLLPALTLTAAAFLTDAPAVQACLLLAGIIISLVLGVPAALDLLPAPLLLAEQPAPIRACIRRARQIMQGRKWKAVQLALPELLILWAAASACGVLLFIAMLLMIAAVGVVVLLALILGLLMGVLWLVLGCRMVLMLALFCQVQQDSA